MMPNPAYVLSTGAARDEPFQELKSVLQDHGIEAVHVPVSATSTADPTVRALHCMQS
jgi:hypothetical protein